MSSVDLISDVVAAVYNNLQEKHVRQYKGAMTPKQFRDQFGTVKISLSRGMGHTTAGINLLTHYPNSIMVVPNQTSKQWMSQQVYFGFCMDRVTVLPQMDGIAKYYSEYVIRSTPMPMLIVDNYTTIYDSPRYERLSNLLELANPYYELLVLLE